MNKNTKIIFILAIIISPLSWGFLSMMNALNSRRQNYTEALTAYNKGDCQLANQNFNQVLESPKFLDKFDRYNAKVTEYKTTCDYLKKT